MSLSPLGEAIVIDALDGGHMWLEPQNRLTGGAAHGHGANRCHRLPVRQWHSAAHP